MLHNRLGFARSLFNFPNTFYNLAALQNILEEIFWFTGRSATPHGPSQCSTIICYPLIECQRALIIMTLMRAQLMLAAN